MKRPTLELEDFVVKMGAFIIHGEAGEVVPASPDQILLVEKDPVPIFKPEFYHFSVHDLVDRMERSKEALLPILPTRSHGNEAFLRISHQDAMSIACRWFNYYLKRIKEEA